MKINQLLRGKLGRNQIAPLPSNASPAHAPARVNCVPRLFAVGNLTLHFKWSSFWQRLHHYLICFITLNASLLVVLTGCARILGMGVRSLERPRARGAAAAGPRSWFTYWSPSSTGGCWSTGSGPGVFNDRGPTVGARRPVHPNVPLSEIV